MVHTGTQINPKIGQGDWAGFAGFPIERIFEAAQDWKASLRGVDKPWLCWNTSHRWCILQQKLARYAGWTPLVGFDPRVGPPPLEPGAVLIDFNAPFQFPVMWMHFPMEFAFLYTERLAFWHSDLLCRKPVMESLARSFGVLRDGELAAIFDMGGRRHLLNFRRHRYWELCGCTTRAASENQFYNGAGWWRNFHLHVKCVLEEERQRRARLDYDHGVGVLYWKRRYHGVVREIDVNLVKEGHCSMAHRPQSYKPAPGHQTAMRDMSRELDASFSIDEVARELGIDNL